MISSNSSSATLAYNAKSANTPQVSKILISAANLSNLQLSIKISTKMQQLF